MKSLLNNRNLSIFFLFWASLFWGTTYIFSKVLVGHLSVTYIIFSRSSISFILLYLIFFKQINREFFPAIKSNLVWGYALTGFVALFLQTYGLIFTSASNSAFISALFVVIVPIIKHFFHKEKMISVFWFAVFIAVLGLYFVSFGFSIPKKLNPGDLLAFLCAFIYGVNILLLEKTVQKFSGETVTFFYFLIFTVFALTIGISTGSITSLLPHVLTIKIVFLNVLALAILGSVIPYYLMALGQRFVPSQQACLIYNLEPIFAGLLSFLFLSETFGSAKIIGSTFIIISMLISTELTKNDK